MRRCIRRNDAYVATAPIEIQRPSFHGRCMNGSTQAVKFEPVAGARASGSFGSVAMTGSLSLEGVHGTVEVPGGAGFWRNWRAFVGPAILISVGYMDPGNWGTDLQ